MIWKQNNEFMEGNQDQQTLALKFDSCFYLISYG